MRRLIYNIWSTNAGLMALLPGGLFGDRVEIPSETLRPFGILTHEGPLPGMASHLQSRTTLWVHDEPGDYTRIDAALKEAKNVLLAAVPATLNGVWLNDVQWEGVSLDLFDDTRRTNVKNAAFLLTGNGL
jgi:hypothetical protein